MSDASMSKQELALRNALRTLVAVPFGISNTADEIVEGIQALIDDKIDRAMQHHCESEHDHD